MKDPQTSMCGRVYAFPTTSWTVVLGAGDPSSEQTREHLEWLCARYWKPVYGYIRWRWTKKNEDAKDMAQAFFAWFLERDLLSKTERGRGRFRHFLRVSLENFLRNQDRASKAVFRGGKVKVIPIEVDDYVLPLAAPGEAGPRDFDELWAANLLQEALQILHDRYQASQKLTHFRVLELYYLGEEQPTYEAVAEQLGISSGGVQSRLKHVRSALRGIVRTLVRETVGDVADLDAEIREIFGEALGR